MQPAFEKKQPVFLDEKTAFFFASHPFSFSVCWGFVVRIFYYICKCQQSPPSNMLHFSLHGSHRQAPVPLKHTSEIIDLCVSVYARDRVLCYPHYKTDVLKYIPGAEFAGECYAAAKALVSFGIAEQEPVGIYSPNRQECLYCELGLFAIRGISVPFYFTASPDQVSCICRRAGIRLVFVGEQYQYNNAYQVQREKGQIERIVIFDRRVVRQFDDTTSIYYDEFVRIGDAMRNETLVKQRKGECTPADIALLVYTSGTHGDPKGVIVTHNAIVTQINSHIRIFPDLGKGDVSVDFLPQSHIFEKMWVYFSLTVGIRTAIITDPKRVRELLTLIRPTVMCNVPRFWEKVYAAVLEEVESRGVLSQKFFHHGIRVAKKYRLLYRNRGRRAPLLLEAGYRVYSRLIFRKIRHRLGLQRGRLYPTAGAYLSDSVNAFLQACGFPILVGYGLSESCATVSVYPRKTYKIGSVGDVIDNVKVRIDPSNDEIQLKGPTITKGYYNEEDSTREAFTEDGWFKTGDAGRLEGETLYFRERIKDLFKTANGKYIAPQQIEALLDTDPYIEQVACIAENRRFAGAVVYPNWSKLIELGRYKGIIRGDEPLEELSENSRLKNLLMARIELLQGGLAAYEKIKRIVLITKPFSVEDDELTHTLKLRRKEIELHYAKEIQAMYCE